MNEVLPREAPQERARTFSLFLEWLAPAAGCAVGFSWWVIHRAYFDQWYWSLTGPFKSLNFPVQSFDVWYAYLNSQVAMAQGITVGFVTGCLASRHPYALSLLAMLLTFAFKFFHDVSDIFHNAREPYETPWAGALLALVYISTPLLGAYLAQTFLRKRVTKES